MPAYASYLDKIPGLFQRNELFVAAARESVDSLLGDIPMCVVEDPHHTPHCHGMKPLHSLADAARGLSRRAESLKTRIPRELVIGIRRISRKRNRPLVLIRPSDNLGLSRRVNHRPQDLLSFFLRLHFFPLPNGSSLSLSLSLSLS
jgi:hypothetical protein